MTNMNYEKMIGKTVVSHSLADDGSLLTLQCKDGSRIYLTPSGACCSSSWIESIDAPDALHGTIHDVEDREMPDLGHVGTERHPSVDYVRYYGLMIATEKGRCVIDYRNDSNGYYGGWLTVHMEGAP